MNRRACIACLAGLLAVAQFAAADETLRIVPITHETDVLVSFELADSYSDDIRNAIASGLRTTFTYDVDLRTHVPLWVDRSIATVVVTVSDQFDNLTRRHTLSRTVDGRSEQVLVTEDEAAVRKWLTTWDRLPLCRTSVLDPNRDYYVRISARSRPHGTSILGLTSVVTGQAKFTFIP